MDQYHLWNQALLKYFVEDAPPGTSVFLSIEPAVLADASRLFGPLLSEEAAVQSLTASVREVCLRKSGRLNSESLTALTSAEAPRQLPFLATLVLAAYRMQDDDSGISERCYYIRLAEAFGTHQSTRLGMGFGFGQAAEDRSAWEHWNRFLVAKQLKPTARPGVGPWTHIRYPVSQTLLRLSDQQWLEQGLFAPAIRKQQLSRYLSRDQLGAWLRRAESAGVAALRRRIHDLVEETDQRRREAFLTQAYAIYTDTCPTGITGASGKGSPRSGLRRLATRVDAGLLRRVRLGRPPQYWVHPQNPVGRPLPATAAVLVDGHEVVLEADERPGWCCAAWPAGSALGQQVYELKHAGEYTSLLFPGRALWMLVRDPLDVDTPERASWHDPTPGEAFLALARSSKRMDMEALRAAGLVGWRSGPTSAQGLDGWDEYVDCRVLQTVWSLSAGEVGCDVDIFESLRPGKQERVVVDAGLRVPGRRGAWLRDCGPTARGFASCEPLSLCLRRLDRPTPEVREPINPGNPWDLRVHAAEPGEYELWLVHRTRGGEERILDETRFRIVDWTELEMASETALGVGRTPGSRVERSGEPAVSNEGATP